MSQFIVLETDKFLSDVEEAAVWILESNLEFSEDFAIKKVEELQKEIEDLKERLKQFPESGEMDEIKGVRKFPVYNGRFSVKWIFQKPVESITLIALTDSKYPKTLKGLFLEDL